MNKNLSRGEAIASTIIAFAIGVIITVAFAWDAAL